MPRAGSDFPVESTSPVAPAIPRVALLGCHPYSVMVTEAGSGVSRHGDHVINRWRSDATTDAYGQWCYLMNVATGATWSAGLQPVAAKADSYEAKLNPGIVTIARRDGDFETVTEIVALPGGLGEARRSTVSNHSDADAEVELTSYQEVVLATALSDRGHRAFGNLFVETEWLPAHSSIVAMRRPRSARMDPVWCGHSVAVEGHAVGSISCETDRARFLGRGRTARNPVAMDAPGDLSGSSGAVLDPVLALRARLRVPAGGKAATIFTTFPAADRAGALDQASRHCDFSTAETAFLAAIAAGDPIIDELGIDSAVAAGYQDLAARLIYGIGRLPAGTRDDLLTAGLTGEWPLVVARVAHDGEVRGASEVLKLQRYWEIKGIAADLILLCGSPATATAVRELVAYRGNDPAMTPRLLVEEQSRLGAHVCAVLDTVARLRLTCGGGRIELSND